MVIFIFKWCLWNQSFCQLAMLSFAKGEVSGLVPWQTVAGLVLGLFAALDGRLELALHLT